MTDKKKKTSKLVSETIQKYFEALTKDSIVKLPGDRNLIYIQAKDETVFKTKPDGELIGNIQGQKKCDYLLIAQEAKQVFLIELKGRDLPKAYIQILDTINFLSKKEEFNSLLQKNTLYAFIVTTSPQRVPRDILSSLRQLQKKINEENIYLVSVDNNQRFTRKDGKLTCSKKYPIPVPLGLSN